MPRRPRVDPRRPVLRIPPAGPSEPRLVSILKRRSLPVCLVLLVIGSVRIVSTYWVFNHTIDEPAHLACGMEWLDKKAYTYETQHPPLARVMAELGPYLAGAHSLGYKGIYSEGAMLLAVGGHYERTLALARLGVLPFFWMAGLVTYWWARRYWGPLTGVLAVFLFTSLPPILAHGGLATTDMALTAFVSAAILAMLAWLEAPSWWRGVLFGACVGLAVLSKFSALVFLPAAAAVMLVAYVVAARPGLAYLAGHGRRLGLTLGLAIVVACLAVWAGYRFSIGKVRFANLRLPAPELYLGIETVADHNAKGHPSYLLGERSDSGFWYYYPVVLAVKTPLPFLILLAIGAFLCVKQPRAVPCRMPVSFSVGILAVALFSNINIGVRHVLAAYVGFSIMGAIAVSEWLGRLRRSKWRAWTLGVLLAWMTGSSALAHPDYLAYFNELVGAQPEKVLADSDLDWGQDMKRLGKRLQQLGAREVTFNRFIVAHNEELLGFPPVRPGSPVEPSPGWNAVSTTVWKVARLGLYNEHPEVRLWPDVWKPTERVGKGTLLYYVPSALFTKPTR